MVPADAVVRAGLSTGLELDRPRLRALRNELRRSEALGQAARALRHRDLSTKRLAERLDRAGAAPPASAEAIRTLTDAGVLDDERLAATTARALADRGWGDAAIRFKLGQAAVGPELTETAVSLLEPEPDRAARIIALRGRSAKTVAYLARRGFSEDSIEASVGDLLADAP